MGLKLLCMLLLASFLLVTTTRASYADEELLGEALALCPAVKEPTSVQKPVRAPVRPSPRVQPPALLPKPPVRPTPLVQPPALLPNPPVLPPVPVLECVPKCRGRCGHFRKIRCLWACMRCCEKCKCVPPGIYGNRDKCGKCYTDMTNRSGSPMCP